MGTTSDDTAHTIILAESIIAHRSIVPDDIGARLVDWYRLDRFGIGAYTSKVLGRMNDGLDWEEAAPEVLLGNPSSAGNGSLMRCAPVALFRRSDQQALIADSRLSSRVTHPQEDTLTPALISRNCVQRRQLVKGIDHYPSYFVAHRALQLLTGIGVPVQINVLWREPECRLIDIQFSNVPLRYKNLLAQV